MKEQIIHFTEKNVDGCGSDAHIAVSVTVDKPLDDSHRERLQQEISEIKVAWGYRYSTDELVFEALSRVFGDDACIRTVVPAITIEF